MDATMVDEYGDVDLDDDDEVPAQRTDTQSVLSGLRDRRSYLESVKLGEVTYDRDVPGYEGDLVVRYRYIPADESRRVGEKLRKVPPQMRQFYAAVDTLILGCVEVLLRVNGELRPLSGAKHIGEDPVGFDSRLGEALGFEAQTARQAVIETFGSEYSIMMEAAALTQWMATMSKEVDDEFMGE